MQDKITNSAQETMEWARKFATTLKPGTVICLHGDLGAGKTTLVKGLAQGLGLPADHPVTSPTFAIMNLYSARMPVYHFDCYRIDSADELLAVGFEDFVNSADAITCIEWPERAGALIPEQSLHIYMEALGSEGRRIRIEG